MAEINVEGIANGLYNLFTSISNLPDDIKNDPIKFREIVDEKCECALRMKHNGEWNECFRTLVEGTMSDW